MIPSPAVTVRISWDGSGDCVGWTFRINCGDGSGEDEGDLTRRYPADSSGADELRAMSDQQLVWLFVESVARHIDCRQVSVDRPPIKIKVRQAPRQPDLRRIPAMYERRRRRQFQAWLQAADIAFRRGK